ncbi:MAG: FecR family protein [Desulfobacteraceae bacterium]|nr:FecR family protein [Pseudomonadota bacterium]MCG2758269.1 FecR family protein [Desulfobacteraceae bacterium]
MKLCINRAILFIVFLLVLLPYPVQAEHEALSVEIEGGKAEVTLLEGKAFLEKKDIAKTQDIYKGDYLVSGDRVSTDKQSRIELKLPDESFIRFDEETTFELASVNFDEKTKNRDINVNMALGKTWANVSKILGRKGRFAVATRTAVAGVRGTVYRINVNKDNSVVVKVYWGEIDVSAPSKVSHVEPPKKVMKPSTVAGPHPVPGPHPVSMEEWTYIVRALQQIVIRPDGTALKPEGFDLAKDDLIEWVRWNKRLDAGIRK